MYIYDNVTLQCLFCKIFCVEMFKLLFFRPINFLGGFSNRYSIAATFGATASTCLEMFLSGESSFPLSGPAWVKGE